MTIQDLDENFKNDDILNLSKLQQDKNKKEKRSICHEYKNDGTIFCYG